MITAAKIADYDGHALTVIPDIPIDRELLQKQVKEVEIRLDDGRTISVDQRKKIFAIIRDIALWSGDNPKHIRPFLTLDFCIKNDLIDLFSLSDCDMTTAKEFITYLINFCFYHEVPTKDTLLNQCDDIGKYLYLCLEHRECAVCNKKAEVHHVDRIGMGFDREKVVHIGLKSIALCRGHHEEAHANEKDLFEKYFIYGIKLDKYLCDLLSLNSKERRR